MADHFMTMCSSAAGPVTQRSSFLELPEDILVPIIDALMLHDKTSLVRTCRYIRELVEPLLYRHLRDSRAPGEREWANESLFITLMARPVLVRHVHSYAGPLTPYDIRNDGQQSLWKRLSPDGQPTIAERIEVSTALFTQATNIRDVHFTRDTRSFIMDIWEPVSQTLLDKKLERLAIGYLAGPTSTAALLRIQTGLRRLRITSNARGWEDLDGADLPMLEHLSCTAIQAASIVPGRPVGRLEIRGRNHENVLGSEELFQKFTLSIVPIIEFLIQFPFCVTAGLFQRILQLVCRYLPQVESLTIVVSDHISGAELLHEIPSFKYLKHLQLWETWLWNPMITEETVPPRRRVGVEDWEFLISRAKELCPTLVTFEYSRM
ncbi:hypothetical protein FRC00_003756 [Tulasnella sp. 408]|nr:hypothetical protein FRC00_003756 [Tulasnella sp. 408]